MRPVKPSVKGLARALSPTRGAEFSCYPGRLLPLCVMIALSAYAGPGPYTHHTPGELGRCKVD
jgi:hypothetical protein